MKRSALKKQLQLYETTHVLNLIDLKDILSYLSSFDSEQALLDVDLQYLELLQIRFDQRQSSQSELLEQKPMRDILTLSTQQLLAICREKDLVPLFQYVRTIQNKSHHEHSYYGFMLLRNFPNQFFLGPKCTHYHCRTTAHKIERQYGIFNGDESDRQSNSNKVRSNDSDDEFIARDGEEEYQSEEEEQVEVKKSKNRYKKQKMEKKESEANQQSQNEQSYVLTKRGRKMRQQLNSQSEQVESPIPKAKSGRMKRDYQSQSQQIRVKRKPNNHKSSAKANKQQYNQQLLLLIQQNENKDILKCYTFQQLFIYMLQCHERELMRYVDPSDLIIAIKAQKNKNKKDKKKQLRLTGKRLKISTVNIKQLTLEELLAECAKNNMIDQAELNQIQKHFIIDDHPLYGHQLAKKQPKKYVIQGIFKAYDDEAINIFVQKQYQKYDEDEDEELNEQEEDQQDNDEQEDEQNNEQEEDQQDNEQEEEQQQEQANDEQSDGHSEDKQQQSLNKKQRQRPKCNHQ